MATETLIVVVGGDYLAFEICREILKTAGQDVALVWKHDDERAEQRLQHEAQTFAREFGSRFAFVNEDPTSPGILARAGLRVDGHAGRNHCLVAVSQDDRLNLRVALAARDLDENVQITLRQFNPLLGRKIQEGLRHNCVAISPAAHAAATYAAAAVDAACAYALPFPTLETMVARVARRREYARSTSSNSASGLFGFSQRSAEEFGVGGLTIADAESRTRLRIVGVNGKTPFLCHGDETHPDGDLLATPLRDDDVVVAFGPVAQLRDAWPGRQRAAGAMLLGRLNVGWRQTVLAVRRMEPMLRAVLLSAIVVYFAFVAFFAATMHLNLVAAMFYVTGTMTTAGSGDISPCHGCADPTTLAADAPIIGTMLAMVLGIGVFAIFTATITSSLGTAQARRLQGLRPIHRHGHVIVCGAGNVGSLVIDYLLELGERVVVVERNPDALLIELARDRKIDLLTGDATNDETIGFCAPERAKALVGVTNSDTANLEAALGARSRTLHRAERDLNVVLRIDDLAFGSSIKRNFGINSFSTTELTAPTIAGLARFESTRGRFDLFEGYPYARRFQLAERVQGDENAPPPAPPERLGYKVRWLPLYVWREDAAGRGEAVPIHNFDRDVRPGDRLLFMVPLDQFIETT